MWIIIICFNIFLIRELVSLLCYARWQHPWYLSYCCCFYCIAPQLSNEVQCSFTKFTVMGRLAQVFSKNAPKAVLSLLYHNFFNWLKEGPRGACRQIHYSGWGFLDFLFAPLPPPHHHPVGASKSHFPGGWTLEEQARQWLKPSQTCHRHQTITCLVDHH